MLWLGVSGAVPETMLVVMVMVMAMAVVAPARADDDDESVLCAAAVRTRLARRARELRLSGWERVKCISSACLLCLLGLLGLLFWGLVYLSFGL